MAYEQYIVSYLSLHDGNMVIQKVYADSEVKACMQVLNTLGFDGIIVETMEEVHDLVSNGDSYIGVMEL